MEAKTFREAYGVLQEHAQTLRQQKEPNIDELLSIVTESVAAYNVCKERIDAVEKALQEALSGAVGDNGRSGAGAATGEGDRATASAARLARSPEDVPAPAAGFDKMDDDIPF